ncbi:DNA-binding transcriptional regulator ModE [Pigmentiphaga humi]|uniref:DNA-binding transcriptional regulator ModE n=1 Tax=Pigmentiphaga humi TaxID=2478468 RepID=A0A3P4B826_9BURK|nr:substrate-binding domain-containing protein [Pigmentiphaga humi]VCU71838.1 DNA-binding transcriptional regulator ModE [Pigmentiphaga humi]
MKIEIRPSLYLVDGEAKPVSLVRGVQLLRAVEDAGNLQAASRILGISYRHAWNALAELDTLLGGRVVEKTRGRGAELTELGRRLVGAQKLIHARVDPLFDSMATEIEAELRAAVSQERHALKVYASHGFAIEAFSRAAQRRGIALEMSYRGSVEALNAFNRGNCDVAGFHVPIGALEGPVLAQFSRLLHANHRIVSLATRRQGIMVAKGNPRHIWGIQDLMQPDVQFVNRQQGSGTRAIFDLLLAQAGKSGRDINGYENVELTHAAIAAYILCGKADAGLGVETAARRFDLDFVPLLSERYLFVCRPGVLDDPRFTPVMALLQSSEFRAEINTLPGYDAVDTGTVSTMREAFPPFAGTVRKS